MTETGTTLPRHAAPRSSFRSWGKDVARFTDRFRKPVVAASLIFGDAVAAIAAISVSRALIEMTGLEPPNTRHLPIVFLILAFFSVRLYTGCGPSPAERLRLRAIGIAGFIAIDLLIGFPAGQPGLPFVAGVCKALQLLIFGHYVEAMIRTQLIHLNLWGASTALFGCSDSSRKLADLLIRQPTIGLTPVGFIEAPRDGASQMDRASQMAIAPLPLIGATAEPACIRRHVEFVIFNSANELSAVTSDPQAWMSSCRHLLVEDEHDLQSLWLRTRMLGGAVGIEIRHDLRLRHNRLLKRVMDLLLAIPMALLVWPIIAVLALAIRFVDPGPAFYAQKRVGRNGATLWVFKLRTMFTDADRRLDEHLNCDPQAFAEWRRFFKLSRDPRVLPIIGNFMRRASLDELPQLWNVIRGDMSLVGPRPFPSYHTNKFDEEFQAIRVSVPPGITGMWQVSSRSNGDLQVQKAQDLFYIRNWSIWLDIYILLQTMPAVLMAKGAK